MDAGIRNTKTENTQGIRKFHRNSSLEAISGEILSRMYALNSTSIKIFHRISAPEAISGEISSWIPTLNCRAFENFHRKSALEAISGENSQQNVCSELPINQDFSPDFGTRGYFR